MPTVSRILKFRQVRRFKENCSPWARLGLAGAMSFSLVIVIAILTGSWYAFSLERNLPSIQALPAILETPDGMMPEPTRIYDRTHQHVLLTLENPAGRGRHYLVVPIEGQASQNTASEYLVDAIISVFDPGFWKEPGFSLNGIAEGTHPTLAEQLVSNLLLTDEPASLKRNIRERLLAMQITAQYGRVKVLEWYLNSAEFGRMVYGADAAARVYLGKPAGHLTIAEAALLAAMAQSPGLDPWSSGQLLRQRQVGIIQAMLKYGWIGANEADQALRENVPIQAEQFIQSPAPDFINLALLQIGADIPLSLIYRGGYEIITTLDYDLQSQAECVAKAQMEHLEGLSNQPGSSDGNLCQAATLLPSIQAMGENTPEELRSEIIVIDPTTGEILTWVGGDSSNLSPRLPDVHPASTILSPFLYLTAFKGGMSPATMVWDLPPAPESDSSKQELTSFHGPTRLRIAMVNDFNAAAANLLQQVGIQTVLQTEEKFGISISSLTSSMTPGLAALATQPVSLLKVVQAYAVLANQGVMAGQLIKQKDLSSVQGGLNPSAIVQVIHAGGMVRLDRYSAQVRPIVSDQLAYLVTNVLSDKTAASELQVAPDILAVGQPTAVKASLSEDKKDAWAVGYTPLLTVGVWMGASGGLTLDMAAGLWHAILEYTANQQASMDFVVPEGINQIEVCDPSGLLVSVTCPSQVREVFLQGNEPTQVDDMYREFSIDRQTGLLANIFTPSELVEKKLYLVMPPEAQEWAKAVGLAVPPDTYDEIGYVATSSDGAAITYPKISDAIRGKVDIYGSATGEGFSDYRLQVGQGLNPQEWRLIGDDVYQPVENGLLGTWDTMGLEGDYILELQVIREDMRVNQLFIPVTVDNHPPTVLILTPGNQTKIDMAANDTIVLQVKASDNQSIARLEFYVDDVLVATLFEPPFIVPWPAKPGTHNLRARAYDQAGNWTEAKAEFSISQ
jgi:membrane peptidoglycan carboxypeptidase